MSMFIPARRADKQVEAREQHSAFLGTKRKKKNEVLAELRTKRDWHICPYFPPA